MNLIRDILVVVTVLAWLAAMPATWAYFRAANSYEAALQRPHTANVTFRAIALSVALAVTQALLSTGVIGGAP